MTCQILFFGAALARIAAAFLSLSASSVPSYESFYSLYRFGITPEHHSSFVLAPRSLIYSHHFRRQALRYFLQFSPFFHSFTEPNQKFC